MIEIAITAAAFFGAGMGCALYLVAAKEKPPATREPEPAPQAANPWHPMPCGRRLELGATGYWIELVGRPGKVTYKGYDPEGDCIIGGQNLSAMKVLLQEQAAFRAEFVPPTRRGLPHAR